MEVLQGQKQKENGGWGWEEGHLWRANPEVYLEVQLTGCPGLYISMETIKVGTLFKNLCAFILFSSVLGLGCCGRAFSSCGVSASHCGGFSCCRAQALGHICFSSCSKGLVALHVGSSQTRDWTYIPCIGRWILNQWITREAPKQEFFMLFFASVWEDRIISDRWMRLVLLGAVCPGMPAFFLCWNSWGCLAGMWLKPSSGLRRRRLKSHLRTMAKTLWALRHCFTVTRHLRGALQSWMTR